MRSFFLNILRILKSRLTFVASVLLILQYAALFSQTSVGSGNWNNPLIWAPAIVPGPGSSVTISAGTTVNLTAPAECADLTISNGTFNIADQTFTLTGNFTFNGGNLNMTTGVFFYNDDMLTYTAGSFSWGTGTVVFNRGTDQIIPAPTTYHNVILSGAGQKILLNNATLNGDLTINDGTGYNGNGRTLTLKGNWVNNSTTDGFNEPASPIIFSGTTPQSISSINGETFGTITLSNSAGITLNCDITATTTNISDNCCVTFSGHTMTYGVLNQASPPVAICKNPTVYVNGLGQVTISPADVNNGSTVDCGVPDLSIDLNSFDCTDLGTNSVILTVKDIYGTQKNCTSTLTVADTIHPTITCPPDVNETTSHDGIGDCTTTVTLGVPTTGDNCSISGTIAQVSGATINPVTYTFPVGESTVTWIVSDVSGNTRNCAQKVTIEDNEDPVINTCVPDKDVILDASCHFTLPDYTNDPAISITECSAYTKTQSPLPGTVISDTTTVTLTVTDEYGNTATCDFKVNTIDNIAPIITTCVPDKDVILDASCNFTLPDYTNDPAISITECSTYTKTQSPLAGTVITDTTTVTLTVTDEYGNTATCDFQVNTIDNIAPIITTCVPDKDVILDASCNFTLPDYTNDPAISITECSAYTKTQSPLPGTVISDTTTVTLTVTDEYGNTATCDFQVNTIDNIAPIITTCVPDKDVILDASCNFTLPDYTNDPAISITECSTYIKTQSPLPGTVITDTTTVTLTVTDEYGNTATCNFEVNAIDNINPVINTCVPDKDVILDASCHFTLPDYTNDPAISVTECSAYTKTQSPLPGTVISDTTTVTLTVTDEYGNTATCDFKVNTIDNIAPIITTCVPDKDVILDASCNYTLPDYTADPALSITECSAYKITQSPLAGTGISDTTTITLSVTDEYGNLATCNFRVLVNDTIKPTFTVPANDTICRDLLCNYDADATITDDVIDESDNCSIGLDAIYTDNLDNLKGCDTAGYIIRSWSVTDKYKNSTIKNQIIWVEPVSRVTVSPKLDTICNGDAVNILLHSPTVPTRPVRFRYVTEAPAGVTVTPASANPLPNDYTLTNTIVNTTDNAQLVKFIITPYTRNASNEGEKCTGINDTAYVWVEPTAKLGVTPKVDTICNGDAVNILLHSPTIPTRPVR
ncbi:MAG TPA: HYR domain-containing protein, partial [Bacteroidales bacterium]|nr:HYR domain-containing protein [Bacteroidales bacterium]